MNRQFFKTDASKKRRRVGVKSGTVFTLLFSYLIFMATLDMVSQTNAAKTPEEYYKMFKCSCCGKPIDTDCCETSRQRKAHLDKVLLEEKDDNAVVLKMVKKFGYEVLMDRSKEQEVKAYAKRAAAKDSPKIVIENPRHNFGTIRQVDGVVVTAFNIKNKGRSDLVITELDTSCGCTSASLVYRGQKSPAFSMSMHGKNPKDFKLKIPPGDTAILEVSYDPNAHGKQEKPEIKTIREVYIMSNDPVDFYQKVKVELVQIP